MSEGSVRGRGLVIALLVAGSLVTAGAAGAGYYVYRIHTAAGPSSPAPASAAADLEEPVGDIDTQVHNFCGACHNYPPPDTFPKSAWRFEVKQGYEFFNQAGMPLHPPNRDRVIEYFEAQAPEELPPASFENATTPVPVRFEQVTYPPPPDSSPPAVSNVNLVHLYDDRRLDILACDMRWSQVMVLSPYEKAPAWKVLYRTDQFNPALFRPGVDIRFNPAHAEVVDLDGDGIKDILVANLGSATPTDRRFGSVVWLRGKRDGTFTPVTLLENVGRVADVQAADFRGTGKLDLLVAVFGWNKTGEILFLENRTTDWEHPEFVPHVLDKRHGTIHVPVADLNGDGKPDFVALISQEHETVVAFLNEGDGKFRAETIYRGPHPAYGSSGIQLADLDGDGKVDVLYTNGDVMDEPHLLKPYHSVQWLRNPGNGKFPWEHHAITPMYGVHRAVAADFAGSGRKDIVAVAFLPKDNFRQRARLKLDSIVYLEQTAPGQFARHSLETVTCDHVTCVAGDVFGTGRTDLVVGHFTNAAGADPAITVWRNLGPQK
jgi:hypothetical protein